MRRWRSSCSTGCWWRTRRRTACSARATSSCRGNPAVRWTACTPLRLAVLGTRFTRRAAGLAATPPRGCSPGRSPSTARASRRRRGAAARAAVADRRALGQSRTAMRVALPRALDVRAVSALLALSEADVAAGRERGSRHAARSSAATAPGGSCAPARRRACRPGIRASAATSCARAAPSNSRSRAPSVPSTRGESAGPGHPREPASAQRRVGGSALGYSGRTSWRPEMLERPPHRPRRADDRRSGAAVVALQSGASRGARHEVDRR